jgi:hypothetical protein
MPHRSPLGRRFPFGTVRKPPLWRRVTVFELRRPVFVLQSRVPKGSRRVSPIESGISIRQRRTPTMKGRASARQSGISEGWDALFPLQSRIFELRSSVFALRGGLFGRSRCVSGTEARGSRAQSGLSEPERHARQARQAARGDESAPDRRWGGSLERRQSTSDALPPGRKIQRGAPPCPRPPLDRGHRRGERKGSNRRHGTRRRKKSTCSPEENGALLNLHR